MPDRYPDNQLNLIILSEECAEVIRIVSKCQRFGLDDYHPKNGAVNRHALEEELGHIVVMGAILEHHGIIDPDRVAAAAAAKLESLQQWYGDNRGATIDPQSDGPDCRTMDCRFCHQLDCMVCPHVI